MAVQTPNGLSRRETFKEIVMQGDVLAPLISSLQVDTMGKECLEEEKNLFYFKNIVPIPLLGLVDDVFAISACGYKTEKMNQYINHKTALKKLQFGTSKCVKLHVGRTCNESQCNDLYVDGWKVEVLTDEKTGKCYQNEYFVGPEKMKVKEEQTYLGDVVSADGSHLKNVLSRKNKGLGIINQIMQILESVLFGKYHFEVAMVLRSSLLLSSILLNSEAWVNLKEKDVRALEQTDEILLSRILGCDSNTSNVFKYLELGVYPLRFEIMKRTVIFLQYILQQDEKSMMFKVFKAICENPLKNDFVKNCEKYLERLDINVSFHEISEMSKYKFKRLVKKKTEESAFQYLVGEKNKQSKIAHLQYKSLNMQDYLVEGNKRTDIAKLIFRARGSNLDIKTQKKWKYEDNLCVGCSQNVETIEEILVCPSLGDENRKISFNCLFGDSSSDMIEVAKEIQKRLKTRQTILEGKG